MASEPRVRHGGVSTVGQFGPFLCMALAVLANVLLVHFLAKKAFVASAAFDEVLPPGCATLGAPLSNSAAPALSHSLALSTVGVGTTPSDRNDLMDGAPPAG
jgi:hypothetical protein